MNQKGISIETTLLLIVGCILVVVVVFLIYGTITDSSMSSTTCMGKTIDWCTRCKLKNWGVTGDCDADGSEPELCSCLNVGSDWERWVQKCIDSSNFWNFDPSTNFNLYWQKPIEYCPRVGVS